MKLYALKQNEYGTEIESPWINLPRAQNPLRDLPSVSFSNRRRYAGLTPYTTMQIHPQIATAAPPLCSGLRTVCCLPSLYETRSVTHSMTTRGRPSVGIPVFWRAKNFTQTKGRRSVPSNEWAKPDFRRAQFGWANFWRTCQSCCSSACCVVYQPLAAIA